MIADRRGIRRTALLVTAVVWAVAQTLSLDLALLLSGFSVKDADSTAHHVYAITNVGAWLLMLGAGTAMFFMRGRWTLSLTALLAGGVATFLQVLAIGAMSTLLADPRVRTGIGTPLGRFGVEPASATAVAAGSTALAAMVALVACFATGSARTSAVREIRSAAVAVVRSLHPRNLNVVSWLFGPVFQADVRVTGRRRGTYATRAIYLLILLGMLTVVWFGMRADTVYSSGAERIQRMQGLAPAMARFLLWTQFLLLMFMAPLLTAPVICQERTGRTLPALLTTPLTGAQIIFGKLAGRLMIAIILVLLSVPLLLGVRIYGGLDTAFVLKAVAITISATIFAASLGLLASIWSKRPTTAAVVALMLLAIHSLGIPLLLAFIAFSLWTQDDWVFAISPGITLGLLTAEADGTPASFASPNLWMYNVGLNLLCAAVVCLVATAAFRRVMVAEANGQTITVKKKRKKKSARGAPLPPEAAAAAAPLASVPPVGSEAADTAAPEDDDAELAERTSRQIGDNPVLWREIRQSALGGGSAVRTILVLIVAVGGLLLANLYFGPGEEGLHYVVQICGMLLLCAGAAVSGTGAITGEREAGSWTILLTTPLSGFEIIAGKFLGACRRCWIAPALLLLDLVIAVAADVFSAVAIVHFLIIAVSITVFLCGTGTLFSLLFRKVATAGVVNIGLAVCLWIGLPMLAGFTEMITQYSGDLEWLWTAVMGINPVAMTVVSLNGSEHLQTSSAAVAYDLPVGEFSVVEFTFFLTLCMGLLGATGLGAIGVAAGSFRAGSERTS